MAHFAEVDESNIVLRIVVLSNTEIADGRFASGESEQKGIDFLNNLFPDSKTWVQTSYNENFRGKYARIGGTYDKDLDKFIPIKPFDSWVWNDSENNWDAPVQPQPVGQIWNEEKGEWEIPEKPSDVPPSWEWDSTNGGWIPPDGIGVPEFEEGKIKEWDEENRQWTVRDVT